MNREVAEPRWRLGLIMPPVLAGMMLAGCTATAPMQQPYMATLQAPSWPSWNGGYYSPPPVFYAPSRQQPPYSPPRWSPFSLTVPGAEAEAAAPAPPPPLRPVEPEPAAQPVDSSCGWWRLCNLWRSSGS